MRLLEFHQSRLDVIWLSKRRSSTAQTAKNPSADIMINFEGQDTYLAEKLKALLPDGAPACPSNAFNADLL